MTADWPRPRADPPLPRGKAPAREQLFDRYHAYLQVLARGLDLGATCASAIRPTWCSKRCSRRTAISPRSRAATRPSCWPGWRILAEPVQRGPPVRRPAARRGPRGVAGTGSRQRGAFVGGAGRSLAANTPSPSQLASQCESAVRLANALARLPSDYQTVLLLRVSRNSPAEEVAQRMGRTAGAVRMPQMRAPARCGSRWRARWRSEG